MQERGRFWDLGKGLGKKGAGGGFGGKARLREIPGGNK